MIELKYILVKKLKMGQRTLGQAIYFSYTSVNLRMDNGYRVTVCSLD